ncbi:DUF2975 domain-containing protein [Paraflavitalea pollutisoli]|uniref:DUF2975 domain-containing protein n=1 Tax=Paraflavitalea pollutisoli TaxID=3034143 RepID=UPI0023EABBBE|nr:DUF2975 domain-containing protein [Paraflavitalea sp. H1-2-19X]
MGFTISSKQVLQVLHILSWIIFVGVSIEAGSFIFNAIYSVGFNARAADYFQLQHLFAFDKGHFLVQLLLMTIPGVLKATLFYQIVRLLMEKKLDMAKPFSAAVGRFLFVVSYLALATGCFSHWGAKYAKWLVQQGVTMPSNEVLHLEGADVWLFMGVILFVIAHIFKRGIELQSENELTV